MHAYNYVRIYLITLQSTPLREVIRGQICKVCESYFDCSCVMFVCPNWAGDSVACLLRLR